MSQRQRAIKNGDVLYITSCKKCGKETEHYSLSGQCKVCLRSYKLSPEGRNGIKYTNLKSRYGITKDEWHWMLKEQYGKCKICNREMEIELGNGNNSIGCHVDHCHETGIIRGLLCNSCNKGLGFFKDDVSALQSAIIYLNETGRINVN